MVRLLPVAIAVLAIVSLTVVEGIRTGRWIDTDRPLAYCASLLNDIPTKIGDWKGQDDEVDSDVLVVAGADGYVSRMYRDPASNRVVNVWLIVGHAHDTAEHTPDFCYPSQGFAQTEATNRFTITMDDQPDADFWTGVFEGGGSGAPAKRVFWAWFKPEVDGGVNWVAPEQSRWHFGNTPRLFKLYFTATAEGEGDDVDLNESDCVEFAREFLPVVEPILQRANEPVPEDFVVPEPEEDAATTA